VTVSAVSDDNLRTGGQGQGQGQSQGKQSDTSFNFTPAILLEYGNHDGQRGYASLIYAPTITRFLHDSAQNSDNYQTVTFGAQYPFQRLTLDFAESYAQTTGVNQDSTLRTTQNSNTTTFGGAYDIDDKFSFASHVQEIITSFSGASGQTGNVGQGGETSSINSSLSYRLSDKMSFGPNFNFGLDDPKGTVHQTYEQGSLGIAYLPTPKINLFAQGGAEFRQYDGGGEETNPIFSAGIGYTPTDSTAFALNANQSVHSSTASNNQLGFVGPVTNQTVLATSIGVSASQQLFQRVNLSFTFNYNHNDNQNGTGSGGNGNGNGGTQDTLTYQPSIRYNPTAWTAIAVYYLYVANESNMPGAAYHDNQVGVSVSVQF